MIYAMILYWPNTNLSPLPFCQCMKYIGILFIDWDEQKTIHEKNLLDQQAMARILNKFERKTILEQEIENGLRVLEELKAKEEATMVDKSKAKAKIKALNKNLEDTIAKAEETLKSLSGALAMAQKEIDNIEDKVKQEIAAIEKNLEDIDRDHKVSIEATKQCCDYRNDETLVDFTRELEEIFVNGGVERFCD